MTTSEPDLLGMPDYDNLTAYDYDNFTQDGNVTARAPSVFMYALPPRELHYYHVAYFSIAIALGVPGNALVIAAYASLRKKSSTDWYILYIAVLDFIICLFRVPTHLAMEIGEWKKASDLLCQVVYWVSQSVITAAVFLFAFIAIDRYVKICRPTLRITSRFSRNCILALTVCSVVSAIPTFWMYVNNERVGKCSVRMTASATVIMKVYYTVLFASFLVMFLIVIVSYSLVFEKVRRSRQILKQHRARDSSTCGAGDLEGSSSLSHTSFRHRDASSHNPRHNQVAPMSPSVSCTNSSVRFGRFDSKALTALECPVPKKDTTRSIASRLQVPKAARGFVPGCTGKEDKENVQLISIKPMDGTLPRSFQPRNPTVGGGLILDDESSGRATLNVANNVLTLETAAYTNQSFINDSGYLTSTTTFTTNGISDTDGISGGNASQNQDGNEGKASANGVSSSSERWADANAPAHRSDDEKTSATQSNVGEMTLESSTAGTTPAVGNNDQQTASEHHMNNGNWARNVSNNNRETAPENEGAETERNDRNTSVADHSNNQNDDTQRPLQIEDVTESEADNVEKEDIKHLDKVVETEHIERSKEMVVSVSLSDEAVNKENEANEAAANGARSKVHWDHQSFASSKVNGNSSTSVNMGRSSRAARHDTRSFRLALLLLLVTIVFVTSWIPPYVAMVWYFYVGYTPPLSASDIALQTYAPTGYILNSFINPFIYAGLSAAFRNTVISLWRKLNRIICRR